MSNMVDWRREVRELRLFLSRIALVATGQVIVTYNFFVVGPVIAVLFELYGDSSVVPWLSSAALWGAVLGQLTFGVLGDALGRRLAYVLCALLSTAGALLSATASGSSRSLWLSLALWRALVGVGVGGEYPLSATITSESNTNERSRGRELAAVFSFQGVGLLLAPLCTLGFVHACGAQRLDVAWRLALAAGGLPGLFSIVARYRMAERKSAGSSTTTSPTSDDERKLALATRLFLIRRYWRTLVGTAGTWFLFDITFYANGLFAPYIFESGESDARPMFDKVVGAARNDVFLAALGLPGLWAAIYLVDRIGRRRLILGGFSGLVATYAAMGAASSMLGTPLFVMLYGASFFFSNCGPNTVTYILPSEAFPSQVRATCHGLSAAAGKTGAAFGSLMIKPLFDEFGPRVTMLVCAAVAALGLLVSYVFVEETMGRRLVELDGGGDRANNDNDNDSDSDVDNDVNNDNDNDADDNDNDDNDDAER